MSLKALSLDRFNSYLLPLGHIIQYCILPPSLYCLTVASYPPQTHKVHVFFIFWNLISGILFQSDCSVWILRGIVTLSCHIKRKHFQCCNAKHAESHCRNKTLLLQEPVEQNYNVLRPVEMTVRNKAMQTSLLLFRCCLIRHSSLVVIQQGSYTLSCCR